MFEEKDPLGILAKDPLGILKKKEDTPLESSAGPSPLPENKELERLKRQLTEGFIKPQRTELPQQLQQSKQIAEFQTQQEASLPKQVKVNSEFKTVYPEQQELTAKVLGFQSAQQLINAQENIKKARKEDEQKAADELYKTSTGKLYFNVIQPMANAASRNIGNVGASIARTLGSDNIADALVDNFTPEKRYEGTIAGSTPTKLQGGLFNNGKMDIAKLPSTVVRGLTDMAYLLAPVGGITKAGQAVGLTEKAAQSAAIFGSSYLQSREGYYQEGKNAGLKGDQLDTYATGAAALTSALESLFPNDIALGNFKKKMAGEYAKQIAKGITSKDALKAGVKEFFKESFVKEPTQEVLQLAGDKIARTLSDMSTGEDKFGNQFDWQKSKDELYETLVITPIISGLAASGGVMQNYKPSNYEKALYYDASKNADKVNEALNRQLESGVLNEEQYNKAKERFSKYNSAVNQVKNLGYSDDQSLQMAWELFSGKEKLPVNQAITADPILKEALGSEVKKDEQSIADNIKQIGMGVPSVGSEIDGKEVSHIISNIGDKGTAISQQLVDNIGDDSYRVEEINVKELYNNNPEFKSYVDSYQKKNTDSDGLLVPAVMKDGQIVDGRSRLAEQYLAGNENVKVFKNISNAINESQGQSAEGNSLQPARIEAGQQIEGQTTQQEANASDSNIGSETMKVVVAPFFNTMVATQEDAAKVREMPEYKAHVQMLNNLAKQMGLEVEQVDDNIGGYENDKKEKVVEVSNTVYLKNATIEQAEEYAAVAATLTPQVQESSIAAQYVNKGDKTHNANEYTFKVSDINKALNALKAAGINNFTVNQNTNEVTFLDVFDFSDSELSKKIGKFATELQNNGVTYEQFKYRPVESRYVDKRARKKIIKRVRGARADSGPSGQNILPTIEQSIKRDSEFRGIKPEEYFKPERGNRLFNERLKEVAQIASRYTKRVFGLERPKYAGQKSIDKDFAKRISDAFVAMKHDPNNPEVKAAYQALAKETKEQYQDFIDAGYVVEINNNEPYGNSQEMIDDLRDNKRIKIFSTESGFGDNPITPQQRAENPLLQPSGYNDINGQPLLINDLFRAIHDFFGHAELGNSFGPIGEENAWQVHARMFSPLARKAMTTETRGQNSFVNFSGVNDKIEEIRKEARKLRQEGKIKEAEEKVKEIYDKGSFAEQKVGLLPEEFYQIDENFKGDEDLVKAETNSLEDELRQELGFDTELNDAIDKATQSLSKAGIKFQVIDNKSGQARGNQAIFQSEEGVIYINKDKLNDAIEAGLVVWHEASHPVMNIIRNTNKPLYDAVVRGMQEAAKTNQDIADALQWTENNYTGEDVQNDEAIVEIIGRINAGMIDIDSVPTSLKQKLIDFINAIAKIFGIDIKGEDIAEFKNTVKQVADYLAKGKDIAGIVGEENVKAWENRIDGSQARVTDYGESGITKEPYMDKKEMIDAVKQQRLSAVNPYESLGGLYFSLTFPDDFFTGTVAVNGELIGFGNGGVFFTAKHGDKGDVWASVGKQSAMNFVTQANKSLKKNNGQGVVVLVKGDDVKHATSLEAKVLFVNTVLKYARSHSNKADVVKAIKSVYSIGNLKDIDKIVDSFNQYLSSGRGESGQNLDEAKSSFEQLATSLIKNSGNVMTDMLVEMGYDGDEYFDKTQLKKGKRIATIKGLKAMYADLLQEDYLKNVPKGAGYAALRFDSELTYEKDDYHPSYPYVIRTKDGSPARLEVFEKTFNTYGKDVAIKGPNRDTTKAFGVVTTTSPEYQLKQDMQDNPSQKILSDSILEYESFAGQLKSSKEKVQASVGNREIINGFYSPIEDRINTFKQPKASVQKWKEIVGVKSDEAVFSGLADWLGGKKPDQQLSKEEVLKFMKDNRIEIKEVVKGKGGAMSQEQMDDVYNGVREQLAQMDMIDDVDEVKNNPLDVWYNNPTDDNYDALGDFLDERNIDLNFIAEADNDGTKFSQYQLPGGENYKEVLITLPKKSKWVIAKDQYGVWVADFGKEHIEGGSREDVERQIKKYDEVKSRNMSDQFKSSHFDEPNIITHLRMNTRTDADGKKVLFLEEVQSDWGQKGKKEGFAEAVNIFTEKDIQSIKQEGKLWLIDFGPKYEEVGLRVSNFPTEEDAIKEALRKVNDENDTLRGNIGGKFNVPKAPYVTNTNAWVKLGLKVALKEAVRQGADKIAWTTGEQQNERYDLSKQVDEIQYNENEDGTYNYSAIKNGREVGSREDADIKTVEAELGKEVADKMLKSIGDDVDGDVEEIKSLVGDNLKVGGKGMKAFYGDAENLGIVGNVAKALVKELTGKEGKVTISKLSSKRNQDVIDRYNRARQYGNIPDALAKEYEQAQGLNAEQPAIDITPELAEAVGGGLPQFSVGNRVESSQDFKLAAFVMRKKAEGAKDAEIALAIASVTKMAPADIKTLIDDPEGYIKSKFPQYSGSVQQNIINRAKNKNIYKKRPLNKPIDAAFGGLQPRQKEIDAIANKTQEKGFKQWIKSKKDKLFDPAKGMPDFFLVVRDLAAGAKNIEIEKAGKTVKNLQAEAKKIGFNDWETFGKAMTETSGVQRNIPTVNVPTSYNPLTAANTPSIQDVELPMVQSENMKKLPESIIPYVYQMRAQIDALTQDLITNGYVTPEQAVEIQKNIGAYVNRSYRMYTERGYNPSPEVRKAALEFLVKERLAELATDNAGALTYEQVQEAAEKYAERAINDILNKKRNPYFGGKEESRNTGILKQRQDIPAPIRKLMGEYEDPGVVFMMTVAKQAALKASSQYLSQLRQFGMGKIFFEENDADRPVGANSKISSEGSESKRPLDGIYTYPEVAEAIEGLDATYNELTNAWMKVVGAVRWGKTVGSIVTQLKNFESNIGFAVMNGLISPSGGKKAMSYWAKQITNKDIDALTEKVIRLNLVGQSVGARELTSMLRGNNLETIALDMALNPSTKFSLSKIANKAYNFSNKLYRLGDDFWKVYAYIAERGQLAEARYNEKYENLGEAEQNKIDVEASERVKNTWPTYDRVWEGAKYISKNAPIFGNFISFQAESIRVLLNTVEMAKNDLMDPQLRGLGAKRMAGIVSYVALRTAIIAGLASFTKIGASGLVGLLRGDDDEDKRKKAMKSAVPPFFRSHDLLYWQNKKEPWKYTVYSLSSVDPYNILPNSINAFTDGRNGMFKEGGAAAAGAELASRFLEPEMTFMTAFEVATNHDSRTGDKIYLDSDPANKAFYKVAAHVWGTLEPSTVSLFKRLYERDNKSAEISAAFGARPYEVDLHKSFQRNLSKMQINFEEISKEYNKIKYGNKYGKQYTPEEIQQAEELAEMKKNYEIIKMHEMYKNYILSGADAKALDEIIKQKSAIKTTGFDKITKKGIKTGDIDTKRLYK